MSIIQKNPMEKEKIKDIPQKSKELEDDKPDYQEKITFLVSTVAQAFILTWCLLVLSLGYIKLPNKLFGMDIPDQPRVDSTFAAGLLGNILGGAVNVTLAVFAGVVTVVPLLLYHAGNRALPISVASLLFYINPTTQLVVGLVYFDLVATLEEWLVFGLIWTGLVLYFASRRRGGKCAQL